MALKSFHNNNPFIAHISDEQFTHMIEQGFERGTLDCYAHLNGDICFKKHINSSTGCSVTAYITENNIALDHSCGGNLYQARILDESLINILNMKILNIQRSSILLRMLGMKCLIYH